MAKGYKGGGTMKFNTRITVKNKKDTYGGPREPVKNPSMGRILLDGNGRTGKQEGS